MEIRDERRKSILDYAASKLRGEVFMTRADVVNIIEEVEGDARDKIAFDPFRRLLSVKEEEGHFTSYAHHGTTQSESSFISH
jgi:hypothetical protein